MEYCGAKCPACSPVETPPRLNCGWMATWLMFSRNETWSPEMSAFNGTRIRSFARPTERPLVTLALRKGRVGSPPFRLYVSWATLVVPWSFSHCGPNPAAGGRVPGATGSVEFGTDVLSAARTRSVSVDSGAAGAA